MYIQLRGKQSGQCVKQNSLDDKGDPNMGILNAINKRKQCIAALTNAG